MSDQFLSRMVDKQLKTTLDHRDGHLRVFYESQLGGGSSDRLGILHEWYPVREATEGEVAMLVGRPVNGIERDESLYADEKGNPYQLSEQGRTQPPIGRDDASRI